MLSLSLGIASFAAILSVLALKRERYKREDLERRRREERLAQERLEQERLERARREQEELERRHHVQERFERVRELRLERWRRRERLEQERREFLDKNLPLMRYVPAPEGSNLAHGDVDADERFQDNWVESDLPNLPLEEHRAVCSICLMDYEEPRRRDDTKAGEDGLEQMQEAPEPIRLLTCGHAYHKSCVDQWLLNKSEKCPYCKRSITIMPSRSLPSSYSSSSSY